MLGYRHYAPLGPATDTTIIRRFMAQAADHSESEWPRLWLESNVGVEATRADNDSACAIDREENFWFIDYKKTKTWGVNFRNPFNGHGFGGWQLLATNRRLVYVPKSEWSTGRLTRDLHRRVLVPTALDDDLRKNLLDDQTIDF